jgi:hypothetical protein
MPSRNGAIPSKDKKSKKSRKAKKSKKYKRSASDIVNLTAETLGTLKALQSNPQPQETQSQTSHSEASTPPKPTKADLRRDKILARAAAKARLAAERAKAQAEREERHRASILDCEHDPKDTCGFRCWYYWNSRKSPAWKRKEGEAGRGREGEDGGDGCRLGGRDGGGGDGGVVSVADMMKAIREGKRGAGVGIGAGASGNNGQAERGGPSVSKANEAVFGKVSGWMESLHVEGEDQFFATPAPAKQQAGATVQAEGAGQDNAALNQPAKPLTSTVTPATFGPFRDDTPIPIPAPSPAPAATPRKRKSHTVPQINLIDSVNIATLGTLAPTALTPPITEFRKRKSPTRDVSPQPEVELETEPPIEENPLFKLLGAEAPGRNKRILTMGSYAANKLTKPSVLTDPNPDAAQAFTNLVLPSVEGQDDEGKGEGTIKMAASAMEEREGWEECATNKELGAENGVSRQALVPKTALPLQTTSGLKLGGSGSITLATPQQAFQRAAPMAEPTPQPAIADAVAAADTYRSGTEPQGHKQGTTPEAKDLDHRQSVLHRLSNSSKKCLGDWIATVLHSLPSDRKAEDCWFAPTAPLNAQSSGSVDPGVSATGVLYKTLYMRGKTRLRLLCITFALAYKIIHFSLTPFEAEGFLQGGWKISLLCSDRLCINPAHALMEPATLIESRALCSRIQGMTCEHDPKCVEAELSQQSKRMREAGEMADFEVWDLTIAEGVKDGMATDKTSEVCAGMERRIGGLEPRTGDGGVMVNSRDVRVGGMGVLKMAARRTGPPLVKAKAKVGES